MHARAEIIAWVVQLLAPIGVTVKAGRTAPLPVASAPYLLVYGRSEQSRPLTMAGSKRRLERELTLAVEIVTASAEDSDSGADALALRVEQALAAQPTLGGRAKDMWLSASTLDARAEGETRTGRARLEFTVTYHTLATAPDAAV